MIVLGALTVTAVFPLAVLRWREARLLHQLVPIATGFFCGRLFLAAEEDGFSSWLRLMLAVVANGLSWAAFMHWSRTNGARAR